MSVARIILGVVCFLLAACQGEPRGPASAVGAPAGQLAEAVFAGGCFWCVEHDFEKVPGVREAISGYTGGSLPDPRYEDVITETTGHYEAVLVRYDPKQISYAELLERFWPLIDPTDAGGQFCDRGPSYRSAVFAATPQQRRAAERSKEAAAKRLQKPIVTEVLPLGRFYTAEAYHQDYAEKNPVRYGLYRAGCGRDQRLRALWGGKGA